MINKKTINGLLSILLISNLLISSCGKEAVSTQNIPTVKTDISNSDITDLEKTLSDLNSNVNKIQDEINNINENNTGENTNTDNTSIDSDTNVKGVNENEEDFLGNLPQTEDDLLSGIDESELPEEEIKTPDITIGSSSASIKMLFPQGIENININDIRQGDRPVCYFLAALAGLAYHRPNDVAELIKVNEDGTYTVSFPGLPDKKNDVTVDPPSSEELEKYIHQGKNGSVWAAVMVKAIAKYWSKNGLLRFFRSDEKSANYGAAWESIEIVTGHKSHLIIVSPTSKERLITKMSEALLEKKLVSVSTFGKGKPNPKVPGDIKISNVHVLTVMKVDTFEQTVTLRDPYGVLKILGEDGKIHLDYTNNGIFKIDIEEFKRLFTDISIETDKKGDFFSRLTFLK